MFTERSLRLRALRAAFAVTVGSAALAGCGTESASAPETDADGVADSSTDAVGDTAGNDSGDDITVHQDPVSHDATEDVPNPEDIAVTPDAVADTTGDTTGDTTVIPDTEDADIETPDDIALGDTADVAPEDVVNIDVHGDDVPEFDVTDDVAADIMIDVNVDSDTGVPIVCLVDRDEQCPAECTQDNDIDCCDEYGAEFGGAFCVFDPSFGCGCAVEGPFAPPSLPARHRLLTVA